MPTTEKPENPQCAIMELSVDERTQNWVDIPGFTGYQVSDKGHVRNQKKRLMRQRVASNGSLKVDLGKATAMVHNLVLRTFTGHALSKGYYPKHVNEDKSDNRLENLVWAGRPR